MLQEIDSFRVILIFITFHGFLLSTLMAVGQVIVNHKSLKNLLFFGFFIDFALFEINTLVYEAGMLPDYVWIQQFSLPAIYILGPLIYWFARFSLQRDFKIRPKNLLHLAPAMASIGAIIFAILRFPPWETGFLPGYFYNSITFWIGAAGSFLFLGYIVGTGRIIKSSLIWKGKILKNEPAALVTVFFFLFFSFAWIADIVSIVTNNKLFLEITMLLLTVTITFLFLVNFKYPDFYHTIQDTIEKEKQRRSYIDYLETDRVQSELHNLMSREKLFLDEDITLPQLAEKLGITTHQLSQLLNDRLNKNFNTFVNEYRVEMAKELLTEDTERTVLSVAYDVGFKSKSSFNAVFLKYTGTTPTQYRKKTPSTR
jgi:AraC-like DNA-binding protein